MSSYDDYVLAEVNGVYARITGGDTLTADQWTELLDTFLEGMPRVEVDSRAWPPKDGPPVTVYSLPPGRYVMVPDAE